MPAPPAEAILFLLIVLVPLTLLTVLVRVLVRMSQRENRDKER